MIGSLLAIGCKRHSPDFPVLSRPQTLVQLCDSTTLIELGTAYRDMNRSENDKEKLATLILEDSVGNLFTPASEADAMLIIQENIARDFKHGNIVKLNGWILSTTEARQCALFSFKNLKHAR